MNVMNKMKKALSLILVFVLVATMLPIPARAADTTRTADTIFFATDRHEETSMLQSLLSALQYTPGLVVLGGDHVNETNTGSLASITSEIQDVYPGVQTFYTYAAHDPNVSEDSSNPYAFARTGEYYEGEDYYVYGVDQDDMQSASKAATASANFVTWTNNVAKDGKVIFVMCHMPIHKRRGDNAGGATWMSALNEAGQDRDIVVLWGHNHTGESSADTSVYFVSRGGSLTPQGGSTGTINFTYMNAGYIKNGYATMALINDESVSFVRYNTSGSVTSTNTMTRLYAAHTHSYSVSSSTSATCGASGSVTYTCSCGETYTETIAATGSHTYSSVTTDASCGVAGSVTYTCAACGYSYTETVAATGNHDYITETIGATCEAAGFVTYTCTTCGYSYVKTIDALGHDYETETVNATCTADGSITSTCSTCGSVYTETIPATGEHVYEEATVAATCTKDGSVTYTCGCGESYAETIPAIGHNYASVTTAPTCTEAGCTTYTCANCGDSYTADETAALGHTHTAVVTAATCENGGYTTYTCACGDTYTADETEALGHDYDSVVTAPACETAGYTTYTCANCGDSYTADETAALSHDYAAVVTEVSCTENGYTTYTCESCGDSYTADEVAAQGHSYTSAEQDGYLVYTCGECGDSYSEKLTELVYNRVTKLSSGNAYVITVYSGQKYYALAHSANKVTAVQVTVSNGKITSEISDNLLWKYSGSKLSYESNGTTYYLYSGNSGSSWSGGSGNVTLSVSSTNSSIVSFSSNRIKVGSYYLRYTGGTIKGNRTATTAYLFEQTEE